MKQFLRISFIVFLLASSQDLMAQYGIGTNRPNESAALEIVSPDKGVLIPSITLTDSSDFTLTGTSSITHDGMIVWNNSTSTSNGLSGVGFYFWENHPTIAGNGNWYRLTTSADELVTAGTVTNTTLRWNGSSWVETELLLVSGTDTATLAANTTVTGTFEVQGASTLATTTIQNDLSVQGSTTLATTTLGAALLDMNGNAGSAGQLLSTTGTSTEWINSYAPTAGTVTHSTLRWDGSAWVESETLLQSDTGTATLAANTTVTGTLAVTGNTTVTGAVFAEGSTTASGSFTAQNTATLEGALVDSYGNTGTAGQILSSTGTATQWIDKNASTMAIMSSTGNVTSTVSLLILTPSSDMTVTLQDASSLPVGFELKIRRNQGYIGTGDLITLQGNGGQTINGLATRNLNIGYQSITLVNIGSEWVSID